MIIAIPTAIAAISVLALYAYESLNFRGRGVVAPTRSGRDPEFARLGETEWYDRTLTSTEWAR